MRQSNTMLHRLRWVSFVLILLTSMRAQGPEITLSGTGWWQDRALRRALSELDVSVDSSVITANRVEDAVFFVMSSVAEEGYLRPEIGARIVRQSGEELTHRFDMDFVDLLPRPLRAVEVALTVNSGVRYTFGEVTFAGDLTIVDDERARALLMPQTGLLSRTRDVFFTSGKLRAGLEQIRFELERGGYAEAKVEVMTEKRDDGSGKVDLQISIEPGPRWIIETVNFLGDADRAEDQAASNRLIGQNWTQALEQDWLERVRQSYYKDGYPDVRLFASHEMATAEGQTRAVSLQLTIEAGEQVRLGATRYAGSRAVKEVVLQRRADLTAGGKMNPVEVEEARRRLQRLQALRRVRLRYEPTSGSERSPVFDLEARDPWELSLLAGVGSYEQVRGGVELKGNNLFSRSHQLRLEAVASLKSLRGDAVYTVPEIFGESVDGNVRLFGLDREELSFQRREYGGSVGLSRRSLPWFQAEGIVDYTFQQLANDENELGTRSTDLQDTVTASMTLGLRRDRRDNPLLPREGQRWAVQVEIADGALGGEAVFQRLEAGWSWHKPWKADNWFHVGFSHGTILTLAQANDRNLPVNKRFFPGGENSYRGLQAGEAVPRDGNGELIGAKSFTMLNLEFEQAITRRFSAVLFWDGLGITARVAEFPWEDTLFAVGAGLRYNTVIGPVRLEYGHNLNPRLGDPDGTWHFSIGYPF